MIASEIAFEQMRIGARNNPELGVPTSYMQVEYGIKELEACWDGFANTSDDFGVTFRSKKEIYLGFANALNEYLEYLGESVPVQVGH
jgi:hypothetical protein